MFSIIYNAQNSLSIYCSAEEVVAHRLHQGEDAETRGDGDDQDAGSLKRFRLLCLDFTQKCK